MSQIDNMDEALSLERFARYVAWAGGDRDQAVALYTLNTQVSEALYIAMQTLDVSLRNRIHTVMAVRHGDRWFERGDLIIRPHPLVVDRLHRQARSKAQNDDLHQPINRNRLPAHSPQGHALRQVVTATADHVLGRPGDKGVLHKRAFENG
jgi:hypothetical protein